MGGLEKPQKLETKNEKYVSAVTHDNVIIIFTCAGLPRGGRRRHARVQAWTQIMWGRRPLFF